MVTATESRVRALRIETTPVDGIRSLLFFAEQRSPLLWMRRGEGFVGAGEALRLEFSGPTRFTDAASAWAEIAGLAQVHDSVGLPGTGLVAFGTFGFADDSSATSVLIVPEIIVGRRGSHSWVTRVSAVDAADGSDGSARADDPVATAFGDDYRVTFRPGELPPAAFMEAVASAVRHISASDARKVVLARDLVGAVPSGSDLRRVLAELALGYPDCWTFSVDGMLGSSPETLVRSEAGTVSARVLAGTAPRGRDAVTDENVAAGLSRSQKDLAEHGFAVQSVLATLGPHTTRLQNSQPFTLQLPNLWHLATDVEGVLNDGSTSLDLVAAMHPTAAVAGTPTDAALRIIRELEPFDRGRYAGPVGWIDAHGDGEWAIALRCAQVDADDSVRAYAGCGIVADSVPAEELAESRIKFRPIVEVFA
ncbi:isochorismate synthase [Leifsonia sp. Leaf325]|nr:chorismate-binding protein [Leifsonia sp. Leaf325]KQQ92969.1 isochorismate synthase [Leifsonia sp. Leaf325]